MREPDVSGPVTGAALTALWRLLSSGAVGAAAVGAVSARAREERGSSCAFVVCFLFRVQRYRVQPARSQRPRPGKTLMMPHLHLLPLPRRLPPPQAEAINAVVDDTTQCKFEAASPAGDEVVLFNILQVCDQ